MERYNWQKKNLSFQKKEIISSIKNRITGPLVTFNIDNF